MNYLSVIPAGFFCTLFEKINRKWLNALYLFISGMIAVHLEWQVFSGNFTFSGHHYNPYLYSHPNQDVFIILDEVEKKAETTPEGKNMFIEVIVPEDGYWPLPWYSKSFPNTGWWNEVDMTSPATPLIICDPKYNLQLTKKMFEIPEPGKRHLYSAPGPESLTPAGYKCCPVFKKRLLGQL